jgi:hypothetical protein
VRRLRITCHCTAGGLPRRPGDVLCVDDALAARGDPSAVSERESVVLTILGEALRVEDEQREPRRATRMAHA